MFLLPISEHKSINLHKILFNIETLSFDVSFTTKESLFIANQKYSLLFLH